MSQNSETTQTTQSRGSCGFDFSWFATVTLQDHCLVGTRVVICRRQRSATVTITAIRKQPAPAGFDIQSMSGLSHFDEQGASRMVDVSDKPVTARLARAEGFVLMAPETLRTIQQKEISKGDVLEVARLAGIMATKRTDELIPLCHSLGLDSARVEFSFPADGRLHIESEVRVAGRTGVEMEALTAVSVAALTVYDMCKAIDRAMEIQNIRLIEKQGGRSGHFVRQPDAGDS